MSLMSTAASNATSDFYYICELCSSVFVRKEKLIINGNFDMMINLWTAVPSTANNNTIKRNCYKGPTRNWARLIDLKDGKVIDAPPQIFLH
jgi:hypothetical protein